MQYLIYDPDYSSSVPYRWSNNTDLKIIEFVPIYNISFFYTFTGYIFRVTFSFTGRNQDITCLTHLVVMVGYILHVYKTNSENKMLKK